jgi:hypothetical protein
MMVALPHTNPNTLERIKWSSRNGFDLTPAIISKGPHPKDKVIWMETTKDTAGRDCVDDTRGNPFNRKERLPSRHNFTLKRTAARKGATVDSSCWNMQYYKVSDALFRCEFGFPLARLEVLAIASSVFYSF